MASAGVALSLLFLQRALMPLFIHHIGVVQLAGEAGFDALDILPAQAVPFADFLRRQDLARFDLPGQLIDAVDLLLIHPSHPCSRSKIKSISSICPLARCTVGIYPT